MSKQVRDNERRVLRKAGWKAVPALKPNGSFVWRWIHCTRKKAYTRKEAIALVKQA